MRAWIMLATPIFLTRQNLPHGRDSHSIHVIRHGVLRTCPYFMKRFDNKYAVRNPFLAWMEIAAKTNEMLLASSEVIRHRVGRMAVADMPPSQRDQREFTRMGQEKIEAAAESAMAMAVQMTKMSQQVNAIAFRNVLAAAAVPLNNQANRNLLQATRRQADMARKAISASAEITVQVSESAARITHHGLTPIHSRATKNAKRLRKA